MVIWFGVGVLYQEKSGNPAAQWKFLSDNNQKIGPVRACKMKAWVGLGLYTAGSG
jgi:hypothetical protein